MRTTVTLDADTHTAVKHLMVERQLSFKQALNEAIRQGTTRSGEQQAFRTKTFDMGLPRIDIDKVSSFLDLQGVVGPGLGRGNDPEGD